MSPDVADARGSDGHISQRFVDWKPDRIYRPVVGVYQNGRLIKACPTTSREKIGSIWLCCYDFDESIDGVETSDAPIRFKVLETGADLAGREDNRTSDAPPGRALRVEDLLDFAKRREAPWPAAGFPTFLSLPLIDEIAILYWDYLNRPYDLGAWDSRASSLLRGETTILDVRDSILQSEEFAHRNLTQEDKIGGWGVWSELASFADFVARPASSRAESGAHAQFSRAKALESSLDLAVRRGDLPLHLARMALGAGASDHTIELWLRDNHDFIAELAASYGRSSLRAVGKVSVDPTRLYYGDILASLSKGTPGERGHLYYGPYIHLSPGNWRATVAFAGDGASADLSKEFFIECVYSDVVFARSRVIVSRHEGGSGFLEFQISAKDLEVFNEARFEFRVGGEASSGLTVSSVIVERVALHERISSRINILDIVTRAGFAQSRPHGSFTFTTPARGHLFYGPYLALPPGDYDVTIAYEREDRRGEGEELPIEVLGAGQSLIVREWHRLHAGTHSLVTRFTIPDGNHLDDFQGSVEIRVAVDNLFAFEVQDIYLSRVSTRPHGR